MLDDVFYGVSFSGCAFFFFLFNGYIHGDGPLYTKHSTLYACVWRWWLLPCATVYASVCICLSTGCIRHTSHHFSYILIKFFLYQVNAIFLRFSYHSGKTTYAALICIAWKEYQAYIYFSKIDAMNNSQLSIFKPH